MAGLLPHSPMAAALVCLTTLVGLGDAVLDYDALLEAWQPLAAAPAPQPQPLVIAIGAIYKGENR
jgi:hypothetical protein